MSIENQKSQEQNQEFDAWVKAKEGISQKNTAELADDLKNIDTPNAALTKQLEDKLNFWDASKAWPTDKLKWTAFENSLEGKSKSEVINLIIKLGLISLDDIKNLSWDAATKKIQKAMFDKISLDPEANDKLQKFLKAKGLPNDGLLDGKFGARTLFALSILIDIPPIKVPEKPKASPEVKTLPDFLGTRDIGRILIPNTLSNGTGAFIWTIKDVFLKSTWEHASADVPFFIITLDSNMDHVNWDYDKAKLDGYKAQWWNNYIISKDLFYKNNLSGQLDIKTLLNVVEKEKDSWLIAKVEKSDMMNALYNNNLIQTYTTDVLSKSYPNSANISKAVVWRKTTQNSTVWTWSAWGWSGQWDGATPNTGAL